MVQHVGSEDTSRHCKSSGGSLWSMGNLSVRGKGEGGVVGVRLKSVRNKT